MSPLKDWLNLFAVSVNATVSEAIFGKFFFGKILLILMLLQYRSNVHVSWQSQLETWFLILEVFENQESNFEAQVSSFEVREPSFETLEEFFEDLEQRFRGNDLILENKTILMNKTIDAQLYSRKPSVECMQIFFCVVQFLQDTCGSLIYTEADDSKPKCVYNISYQNEWLFLRDYNPKRVCCFHLHDFNWPLKT